MPDHERPANGSDPATPEPADAADAAAPADLAHAEEAAAREAAAEASPANGADRRREARPQGRSAPCHDQPQAGRPGASGAGAEARRGESGRSDDPEGEAGRRRTTPREPPRTPAGDAAVAERVDDQPGRRRTSVARPTSTSTRAARSGPGDRYRRLPGRRRQARGERISVELGGLGGAFGGEVNVHQGASSPSWPARSGSNRRGVRTIIANGSRADRRRGVLVVIARTVDGAGPDPRGLARRASRWAGGRIARRCSGARSERR